MKGRTRHYILGNAERPRLRRDVLRILASHRGKENAVTGNTMANMLGMPDDRKVRVVIDELIEEGVAIAASVGDPSGFYIVKTEHEAFEYIGVLRRRRDEIDKRLEAFKRAYERGGVELPEQGAMAL